MFEARKRKKLAEAVLTHVQPLVNMVTRFLDGDPAKLIADKYMLGFFVMTTGLLARQLSTKPLSVEVKGAVLFAVLQSLFGAAAIQANGFATLLESSANNEEFQKGSTAAYKIQAVFSGSHQLQNDPDYLAASEAIKAFAVIPNHYPAGISEEAKIGQEMLRILFYERARDLFQHGTPDSAP